MKIELTSEDIMVIKEALDYSKIYVEEAQNTPYEVQQQNLNRIQSVREKFFKSNMDSDAD